MRNGGGLLTIEVMKVEVMIGLEIFAEHGGVVQVKESNSY